MKIINTIEMFGLCGSGKTTVQSNCNIDKVIEVHNPIYISNLYVYIYAMYIALKMFIISPTILVKFLFDYQSRRLLLKLGLRTASIFKRRKLYKTNTIFLRDSGVIMPFVSAIIEEAWKWNKSYVLLIFKAIPIPKKAVFVYVEPSVAHARYIMRNKDAHVKKDFFYSANEFCQFLYTLLESKGVGMIQVDNNISANCSTLNNKL